MHLLLHPLLELLVQVLDLLERGSLETELVAAQLILLVHVGPDVTLGAAIATQALQLLDQSLPFNETDFQLIDLNDQCLGVKISLIL